MDESAMPTQIEGVKRMSFLSKYKFTIISLCVILVALIPLVIIAKTSKKPTLPTTQQAVVVSPTATPLTESNAQPTIAATDQQIQDAIDQSNQDITTVNSINTTQDSTTGL